MTRLIPFPGFLPQRFQGGGSHHGRHSAYFPAPTFQVDPTGLTEARLMQRSNGLTPPPRRALITYCPSLITAFMKGMT